MPAVPGGQSGVDPAPQREGAGARGAATGCVGDLEMTEPVAVGGDRGVDVVAVNGEG